MGERTRTYRQVMGRRAEDLAVDFLCAQGLVILQRNFRGRLGELDIVARERGDLIIVEVRARSSERYGGAAGSVDQRKQQRIIRAAHLLLQQHRELATCRVRFDVVAVADVGGEEPRIEWDQARLFDMIRPECGMGRGAPLRHPAYRLDKCKPLYKVRPASR